MEGYLFQVASAKRRIVTGRTPRRGFPYFVCNSVQFRSHCSKTRVRKLTDALGVIYKPPDGFVEKQKRRRFSRNVG
jgi:hypothetical protein